MTEVISVRFKNKGKTYYFDPGALKISDNAHVIVETAKGPEHAECVRGNHPVRDEAVVPPLRPVIRLATEADDRRAAENKKKEAEAFRICHEKIEKFGLDMKLVDVEYSFEGNKILFFFTSDGRVDFRELVKELASVFKTRIELRQIGVRDEARMLGGLGICGKPFCCSHFLDDFQPVSIKMAKVQGLSLNPTKISGSCGRLMCCLKYEQEAYEELVKNAPKVDAFVETTAGVGSVVDINLLRGTARVRLESNTDTALKTLPFSDLKVLGGKAARAEYLAARAEEAERARAAAPALSREARNRQRSHDGNRGGAHSGTDSHTHASSHSTQHKKDEHGQKHHRSSQSKGRAGDPRQRIEQKQQEHLRQGGGKSENPHVHPADGGVEKVASGSQGSSKPRKRHGGHSRKYHGKGKKPGNHSENSPKSE